MPGMQTDDAPRREGAAPREPKLRGAYLRVRMRALIDGDDQPIRPARPRHLDAEVDRQSVPPRTTIGRERPLAVSCSALMRSAPLLIHIASKFLARARPGSPWLSKPSASAIPWPAQLLAWMFCAHGRPPMTVRTLS